MGPESTEGAAELLHSSEAGSRAGTWLRPMLPIRTGPCCRSSLLTESHERIAGMPT
jgi:hypothetical protein